MAITVTPADVTNAEDFLEEFLSDKIEDGDYSDGALLRDLSIKAISYVSAYFRKLDGQIRARQSLKSIEEVDTTDDEEAADDAVDEILSNWFASRKVGKFARVVATVTLAEAVDVTIKATDVFYKTSSLAFILDGDGEPYLVAAEDLIASYDSSGEVSGYTFTVPLVSQQPGSDFNIEPGQFVSYDDFSPYTLQVETLEKAQSGKDIETTDEFIERSENLITVRNLINARSCDAVLLDEFEGIKNLTVVGMGDTEMIRDRIREQATGLELHVGGHQDIFVDMDLIETSFSGEVGGKFARPDGIINVFRDATYAPYHPVSNPAGHKFTQADSVTGKTPTAGMALRVWTGLPEGAKDYMILEVRDTEILVSEQVPFPIATGDLSIPTYVTWSIGQMQPDYQDVVAQTATGETSLYIQNSGRITLPGGPVYDIASVTIADDADADADPSDGLVHLYERKNVAPVAQVAPDNEYQLVVHNYKQHQSAYSWAEVLVGPTGDIDKYDGKTLKVTYTTLSGFSTVHTYVADRRRRISGANPLVRGFHPVYLSFTLEYELKKSATETIDSDEAIELLAAYINEFDPSEVLDVSALIDYFRAAYSDVGKVFPFLIQYYVHVPDGRVVEFETEEDIVVPHDSTKLAALLVYPDSETDGLTNPVDYGLGDDVMRYVVLEDDVIVQERAV
jgi:hypothetical protein